MDATRARIFQQGVLSFAIAGEMANRQTKTNAVMRVMQPQYVIEGLGVVSAKDFRARLERTRLSERSIKAIRNDSNDAMIRGECQIGDNKDNERCENPCSEFH